MARYRFSSGWDVPPPGVEPSHQRAYLTTLRGTGKPHGKVFHYVSTNTEVLGWVYERACGMPYPRILSEYLWQPMGAEEDGSLTLDSHGMGRIAGGLSVTERDLIRFGEMIRCRGVVEGRQVVPGWWIDDIRENGDPEAWADGDLADIFPGARYRSKWYTNDPTRGDLAGIGIHGQWLYIDAAADTVIVKLATQPKAMDVPLDHRWLAAFRTRLRGRVPLLAADSMNSFSRLRGRAGEGVLSAGETPQGAEALIRRCAATSPASGRGEPSPAAAARPAR